jgi:hypothetical protein
LYNKEQQIREHIRDGQPLDKIHKPVEKAWRIIVDFPAGVLFRIGCHGLNLSLSILQSDDKPPNDFA